MRFTLILNNNFFTPKINIIVPYTVPFKENKLNSATLGKKILLSDIQVVIDMP